MKRFLTRKNLFLLVGFAFLAALPFAIIKKNPGVQKDDTINPFPEPKDPAAMYIHRASDNYFFHEFDKAADNYRKAIAIYEERRDFAGVAKTYESLGDLFVWASDHGAAEGSYLEAARYHHGEHNALGESNALKEIGDLHMKLAHFSQAEDWYLKSLEAQKDEAHNRVRGSVFEGMGHMYWKEEKLPQAIEAFTQARDTYASLNYNMGVEHMANILYRLENGTVRAHRHALREPDFPPSR